MPARTTDRKPGRTVIPPISELVDTEAAVELTGFSRRHLYRLQADGLLPVFKIGNRNRYWIGDLQALVTRRSA